MSAPPRVLPHIDLLGRDALLGLVYRALAADADPTQAQLSLRRIEQSAAEYTVTAQRRSQLRSALEIAAQKAKEGRRDQLRLDLDLQLFNERYSPPPPKRGLAFLAPKRTKEQLVHDAERAELEQQLALVKADVDALLAKAEALGKQAKAVELSYVTLSEEREQLNARFRGEVAAGVLNLVALGQAERARDVLAGGRSMLRGDLVIGALLALVALFADGADSVPGVLDELRGVWEQHTDPVRRVLEALVRVRAGDGLSRQALGIFPRGNFSHAGLWRLYLLVGMLAAWPPEKDPPDSAGIAATLWAVFMYQSQGTAREWRVSESPAQVAAWAGKQDLVARTLVANMLLRCGRLDLIPYAAGYTGLVDVPPLHYIPPPKKAGQPWPELLPHFNAHKLTAWPLPLAAQWAQALACHVLLAAQEHAPVELYAQWWDESRGWPAGTLHWWTQAELAADPTLLHNRRDDAGGLVRLQ